MGAFLPPPMRPVGFGPVLGQFGASLSNFRAHKALNGSKSCIVGQDITLLYLWGPLGAILTIFKPFQLNFRAQSMILGPVGRLFLTFFATQNGLNGTIHVQWGRV